jgi:hypothetical protein
MAAENRWVSGSGLGLLEVNVLGVHVDWSSGVQDQDRMWLIVLELEVLTNLMFYMLAS